MIICSWKFGQGHVFVPVNFTDKPNLNYLTFATTISDILVSGGYEFTRVSLENIQPCKCKSTVVVCVRIQPAMSRKFAHVRNMTWWPGQLPSINTQQWNRATSRTKQHKNRMKDDGMPKRKNANNGQWFLTSLSPALFARQSLSTFIFCSLEVPLGSKNKACNWLGRIGMNQRNKHFWHLNRAGIIMAADEFDEVGGHQACQVLSMGLTLHCCFNLGFREQRYLQILWHVLKLKSENYSKRNLVYFVHAVQPYNCFAGSVREGWRHWHEQRAGWVGQGSPFPWRGGVAVWICIPVRASRFHT